MAYPYASLSRPRQMQPVGSAAMPVGQPRAVTGAGPQAQQLTAQNPATLPANEVRVALATPADEGTMQTMAGRAQVDDNGGDPRMGRRDGAGRSARRDGTADPGAFGGLIGNLFQQRDQGELPALPEGYAPYPEGNDFRDWRLWAHNIRQTMPNWREDFRTTFGSTGIPGFTGQRHTMPSPIPQGVAPGEPNPAAVSGMVDPAYPARRMGLLGLNFPGR
jgi:hypothetical protein